MAGQLLRRLRSSVTNTLVSQQALLEAYAKATDKRIVLMDKPAAVSDIVMQCPELLYLISPRPDGSWGVRALPVSAGSFQTRQPFPKAWRAQPAIALPTLTGVEDATFCHATGFYAVASSQEGALALAKRSLEQTKPGYSG